MKTNRVLAALVFFLPLTGFAAKLSIEPIVPTPSESTLSLWQQVFSIPGSPFRLDYLVFPSEPEFTAFLAPFHLDEAQLAEVQKARSAGVEGVIVDLRDFRRFPPELQKEILKRTTVQKAGQGLSGGYQVTLEIAPDEDLNPIAKKYAAGRDPGLLLRYLNRLKTKKPAEPIKIPLQALLTPFIRDKIYTYAKDCSFSCCARLPNTARIPSISRDSRKRFCPTT